MRIPIAASVFLGAVFVSQAFLPIPQHQHRAQGYLETNLEILVTKKGPKTRSGHLFSWLKHRREVERNATQKTPIQEVVEETKPDHKYRITTVQELDDYWADTKGRFRQNNGDIDYDELIKSVEVVGDTQIIGSPEHPDHTHPVVQLLHERKRVGSTCMPEPRPDGCRVALAIEGGGMRGCVSAGMVAAIYYLGLQDTIDVVYGSSAGTVIGSYFITRQVQWFGPEIYYDSLTVEGNRFIDTKRLLRAVGLGLVDPRLFKDVVCRRKNGKPVLNLEFLLKTTVQHTKPLNWEKFVEMQKVQPLKVVASGLKSEKSIVMDMANGSFKSLDELANCMHASCLLPGIAGPLMNMIKSTGKNNESTKPKFIIENGLDDPDYEPLADALLYEPLPYHAAIDEGATHVIVLRTRADGKDVTGKSSLFERMIIKRFFMRKNHIFNMWQRMRMHLHKKLYAEDIIRLNEAAQDDSDYKDISSPHLMAIAMPPSAEEISRLETGREAIFNGVRRGFARSYDALVEDPSERGRGMEVAKLYFPDEILKYDPLEVDASERSAFEEFLHTSGEDPTKWKVRAQSELK